MLIRILSVIVLSVAFSLCTPLVAADQSKEETATLVVVDPDTDRELEMLQNKVAELRRKLRLRRMKDIQRTRGWQENYTKTKARIKAMQDFVNKYGLRE